MLSILNMYEPSISGYPVPMGPPLVDRLYTEDDPHRWIHMIGGAHSMHPYDPHYSPGCHHRVSVILISFSDAK